MAGTSGKSIGDRLLRNIGLLSVLLAVALFVQAAAASKSEAGLRTPTSCHSKWIYETGSEGSGANFVVSARPSNLARAALSAHLHTDFIWRLIWRCVPGGFPRAQVTEAQGESLYQQLYCHIKWGIHPRFGGDTWDLEASRPPISWDRIIGFRKAKKHRCNWNK